MQQQEEKNWRQSLKKKGKRTLAQIRTRVPFGVRTLLGTLLVAGGIFGFMPILGFWMIPLGVAVIAIDLGQIWRAFRGR
ncbi:MAG: hypothetical protein HKN30_02620 [Sulfitobacter sp.]|nr:hypothetical protein [Sulfitobacter sp.]